MSALVNLLDESASGFRWTRSKMLQDDCAKSSCLAHVGNLVASDRSDRDQHRWAHLKTVSVDIKSLRHLPLFKQIS